MSVNVRALSLFPLSRIDRQTFTFAEMTQVLRCTSKKPTLHPRSRHLLSQNCRRTQPCTFVFVQNCCRPLPNRGQRTHTRNAGSPVANMSSRRPVLNNACTSVLCFVLLLQSELVRARREDAKERYQSTSVFPTSSNTRRIVEAFLRIAVPQRRAAMHLGHTWYIGKRFCKSTCIFIKLLILKN